MEEEQIAEDCDHSAHDGACRHISKEMAEIGHPSGGDERRETRKEAEDEEMEESRGRVAMEEAEVARQIERNEDARRERT